jgi:hypothetical protein
MYKQIRKQKPVLQKYAELLVSQGVVNQPEYEVCPAGPHRGVWLEKATIRQHSWQAPPRESVGCL